MKRLVSGLIVALLGLLMVVSAGENPQGPATSIILGLVCLAGGCLMIFFGNQYLKQKKTTTEVALQMLRDDGEINAGELAQRLGLSEVDVRIYIAVSQRRGIVPIKADIV